VISVKSKSQRWAKHIARMGDGKGAFEILTGKPTGKRPLARLAIDRRM
jgi:hypothetical protein